MVTYEKKGKVWRMLDGQEFEIPVPDAETLAAARTNTARIVEMERDAAEMFDRSERVRVLFDAPSERGAAYDKARASFVAVKVRCFLENSLAPAIIGTGYRVWENEVHEIFGWAPVTGGGGDVVITGF